MVINIMNIVTVCEVLQLVADPDIQIRAQFNWPASPLLPSPLLPSLKMQLGIWWNTVNFACASGRSLAANLVFQTIQVWFYRHIYSVWVDFSAIIPSGPHIGNSILYCRMFYCISPHICHKTLFYCIFIAVVQATLFSEAWPSRKCFGFSQFCNFCTT